MPSRRDLVRTAAALYGLAYAGVLADGAVGDDLRQAVSGSEPDLSPLTPGLAWPNLRYDAAHTGHVPDGTPVSGDAEVQWRYSLADGAGVSRPPVVADGTVFVSDGDRLSAVAAADGTERWRYDRPAERDPPGPSSPQFHPGAPATDGETVYVPAGVHCHAVDAQSGERRWTFGVNSGFESLTLAGNTALLAATVRDDGIAGLDVTTGLRRWTAALDANLGPLPAPAVADGTVYAATHYHPSVDQRSEEWRSALAAFDGRTGERRWTAPLDVAAEFGSTVAVADGQVVYGTDDLVAVDAADGTERWRTPLGAEGDLVPALAAGRVHVLTDDALVTLDAATGGKRWRRSVQATYPPHPVVVDDAVHVGTDAGMLVLDAETGGERARVDAPGATPVVADGTAYLAGPDVLYAVG